MDRLRAAADGVALQAVIAGEPPSFAHARHLTDERGMIQFARGSEPDISSGYCVDDNARALLAAALALQLRDLPDARYVGDRALDFLERSQLPDGRFHNLADGAGRFTDDEGSEDCMGRAVWTLGIVSRCAVLDDWRRRASALLERSFTLAGRLKELRPRAYLILGLCAAIDPAKGTVAAPTGGPFPEHLDDAMRSLLREEMDALCDGFEERATREWPWWEDVLSWGNARVAEAVLRASLVTTDERARRCGLRAFEFLVSVTQPDGMFVPIGNDGWYHRGGSRPRYDQQPIEACTMIDLWLAAEQTNVQERYYHGALETFGWFLGLNTEGLRVADPPSGGCYDGLKQGAVNRNMGAESTLSYLQAHATIALAARRHPIDSSATSS